MAKLLFFNPLKYKNFNQYQIKTVNKCVEKYGNYIRGKTSKILDVGCGDGYVTENIVFPLFKNGVSEFISTDISKPMIDWAQINSKNKLINYQVMDITKDPPKEFLGKFDLVVSALCLMLVTQQQKKVNLNLYNMLKPNGEIFLIFLAYHPGFSIYKTLSQQKSLKQYMEKIDDMFPLYHTLENESKKKWYCDRLESSGFKINLCEIEKASYIFPSVKNYKDSMEAVNIFPIPNELKEYYYELYMEEARKLGLYYEIDGKETIKLDTEVFVIAAKKN